MVASPGKLQNGQSEPGQDRKVAALRILSHAVEYSPVFFLSIKNN